MFSYRHAFHAGNHADVLKHTVLIATVQYLTEKEAALTVVDTHAGAGLYRLDGDYARTSGESGHGLLQLAASAPDAPPLAPALQTYLDLVRSFNKGAKRRAFARGQCGPARCGAAGGRAARGRLRGLAEIFASTGPPRFAAL